jgi:diguanylate cyclase (GGDEF)-like protein
VDDSYANVFLVENLLQGDYQTVTAGNAQEMFDAIHGQSVDLILLDVMMPGKSGFEAAEELSFYPELRHIPIIFVTAKTSGEDLQKGFKLGGVDYIRKPFEELELKTRVEAALSRREREQNLERISTLDPLTNLYNRRAVFECFSRMLEYALRQDKSLAIVMADIDDFKHINDNYGHQVGDAVLQEFAQILKEHVRIYDCSGRYGGEEFLCIFMDSDKHQTQKIHERILEKLAHKVFEIQGHRLQIGYSAGTADTSELDSQDQTMEHLIKIADERLYKAKQNGKNQVVA